jgi:hypothetical protein
MPTEILMNNAELMRIDPDGNVYVHGRLVTSDAEIAEGMRAIVMGEVAPLRARLAVAERVVALTRRLSAAYDQRAEVPDGSHNADRLALWAEVDALLGID